MSDLVLVHENQAVVSSRIVAKHFDRSHQHVLRAIREIASVQKWTLGNMYIEHQYKVENNFKSYPEYYMNRDGFMLLVMGFTTKPAMQVKLAFIKAFNEMEAKLKQEVASPVLDDYNRNIQRLMNENDDLKEKLKRYQRYAILGWSVEKLSKDDKTLRLASNFIEGCVNP